MTRAIDWVAVDWGTSNLRAWGIDAVGEVGFARASAQGMGKLRPLDYPKALIDVLGEGLASARRPVEIVITGMAGARQGWLEAPYLEAPAELFGLMRLAVSPVVPGMNVRILPGVCQRIKGAEDVMRGEETQLLGVTGLLPNFCGLVVMPGTHSKWAALDGRRLKRFTTAVTGELYDLLSVYSVLRHSLTGDIDGDEREAGFAEGSAAGLADGKRLTSRLFQVRAASLLSGRSSGWCAGFLSGLLIGAEIGGQTGWGRQEFVPLVGSKALCELYGKVFELTGQPTRVVDATDATLAGLKLARSVS